MEKNSVDKYNSFNKTGQNEVSLNSEASDQQQSAHCNSENVDSLSGVNEVSEDVDEFISVLSAIDDKSSGLPDIPDFVKTFSEMVESRIAKYNSGEINGRFGDIAVEDSLFMGSVRRISKLAKALSDFPSDHSNINSSLNQTSVALQRAMAFLEEEFRALLEPDSRINVDNPNPDPQHFHKFSSFNSKNSNSNNYQHDNYSDHFSVESDIDYPSYPPEAVTKMHEIATSMVLAGYETECCQVYYLARRNAIRNHMIKLEREVILNMDDVVKMPWEALETEIQRWISMVKTWSEIIFPGEKRLGESVFSDYPSIHKGLLSNIVRTLVIQLLDFAEAVAMSKRSAEKLFRYLDMYEALQNLIPAISGDGDELMAEVSAAADRIGESAASIFCDLENSIKSDAARTTVPGGAVHPLTRYVMNYLKYACEYKDTLEKVFAKQMELDQKYSTALVSDSKISSAHDEVERESDSPHNSETVIPTTPFSIQVMTLMDLLDDNLNRKSKLYKDPSLQNVFLMNNGRYILQKVKGSNEIRQVMGDTWCRRRSTVVRMYHKNYQRETWNRVLQCLSHDGLLTNGKPNKPLLKERFKIFTTIFDEIHRTQSAWLVSDEQLQSELRISISSVVIPAYRSFVGRFRPYLDSGKQADKYIKYQPEDIESLIEGLFEGNTTSMGRRRT
ncbi:exocyst complex component exo70b1 [Phtheirospermum japonicum]|uniref:Exocyst subunit Exo70 family protein n=1 Tax=Phtheirospermum japonicum TaxID=374723 RepID=A0A830CFZ2_9LAMI|nr:exocyst complex component exo70b1 [Phtheirospermum japonicum]